jgi:hypothetical protein
MSMRTITRRLISRLPRRGDDRGSMAFVFLVIIIGVALGGMFLPIIITQTRSTTFDVTRVQSLDAAQAGIDLVVGEIRGTGTLDGTGTLYGNPAGLPCGTLSGNVNSGTPGTYSVTVAYFKTDPMAMSAAQQAANQMICAPGYGPYDTATNTRTPKFALLTSTGNAVGGNGASQGRTIQTTYVFRTDDTNVSGGVIRIFPSGASQFCMDAGSGTPSAGTAVYLQPCSSANPPIDQQVFAYRSDLTIQLVSSAAGGKAGLCLQAAQSAGSAVTLQTCAPLATPPFKTNAPPYTQQFSVDDNAHLQGTTSTQSGWDGLCINVASQGPGVPLTMVSCKGSVTDTNQTWVPDPRVGAGMAGPNNGQLVNFLKFGNCIDVTGQNVNSTFLILYTCKQNPNKNNFTWNQIWTGQPSAGAIPTPTELYVTTGSQRYCLVSPAAAGGYVTVTSANCTQRSSDPANAQWIVYQAVDASKNQLPYNQKYQIVNQANGLCLDLGSSSDLLNGQYLKITVNPCNGSTSQKWNADPSLSDSGLQNTMEK